MESQVPSAVRRNIPGEAAGEYEIHNSWVWKG